MTTEEMQKYWLPARKNLFPDDRGFYPDPLDVALRVDQWSQWYGGSKGYKDMPMPDEMKRLLIKLAGPHGQTILKAYRVQQGLK